MIAVILIVAVVGILTFVDFTAPIEEAKRCAPSIWKTQWPRYMGCVTGARGELAAGLIAAAGALFAGVVSFCSGHGADRQRDKSSELARAPR